MPVLGNSNIEASSDYWFNAIAYKVVASENGSLQSLATYCKSTASPNFIMALYADAAGVPGTRLAITESKAQTLNAWLTLNLTSPYSLAAGTTYWLALGSADASVYGHAKSTLANASVWSSSTTGTLGASFGSCSVLNYKVSAYGTYTIGNRRRRLLLGV
jgi:hypothetical protein